MTDERKARNAARPRPVHVSAETVWREERITCECGVTVEAEPDMVRPDRHQPLVERWYAHVGRAKRLGK